MCIFLYCAELHFITHIVYSLQYIFHEFFLKKVSENRNDKQARNDIELEQTLNIPIYA